MAGAEIGKFNDSAVRTFFSAFPIVPPFSQFYFTQQFADSMMASMSISRADCILHKRPSSYAVQEGLCLSKAAVEDVGEFVLIRVGNW